LAPAQQCGLARRFVELDHRLPAFGPAHLRRRSTTDENPGPVEQSINLDDPDDVYNWPWLYGVEVGHWSLTDEQAHKLRDLLLRGGFFMCDDFHGTQEWATFIASMQRVFPIARSSIRTTEIPSSTPSSIWTIATKCQERNSYVPDEPTSSTDTKPAGAAFTTTRDG
jgi:hypothetical protein